jgi:hypothetical protein
MVTAAQCLLFGEGKQLFADPLPLSADADGNVFNENVVGSRKEMENGE